MTWKRTDRDSARGGAGRRHRWTWTTRLAIGASILAAVVGVVPFVVAQWHPRRGAVAEAARNLRILSALQARYFADHGRYAPDPDGLAQYKAGATEIQAALPDYRPGPPEKLLFEYEITSYDKGARFIAVARGRQGTAAAGKRLSIDQATRYPGGAAATAGRAARE